MIVFEAFTNGTQAAILVGTGLECLLYFLDANVGERGGFTAVVADSGSGACWCLLVLVFLRFCCGFCWRGLLRAFRAFSELYLCR